MRLLRTVFYLRTIYFRQTYAQIVFDYCLTGLAIGAVIIVGRAMALGWTYAYGLLVIGAGYALLRTIIRTILVNRCLKQYPASVLVIPPAQVANSSINLELDRVDELQPIATFDDAQLFLATFNFYTRTRYGDFLARQTYYTVLEVPLRRTLPHLLFDSKLAKRDQFKYLYLRAQRINVQGPFDAIFDTYVPQTYHIDSLSFVTPDVMEAMLAAKDCDLEIIDDKLLLYAPLLDNQDFVALAAKGQAIARRLNDNIDTYRDNRLTGMARKTDVTLFSRSLLRSPRKYLIWMIVSGLATALIIAGSLGVDPAARREALFNQLSLLVYIVLFTNVWQAVSIIHANRKALETYRILYQTDRGKPIKPKL
jgi:hypothetical protein